MKLQRSLLIISLMVLGGIPSAFPAEYSWRGSGVVWSDTNGWRVGGVAPSIAPPGSSDNIVGTSAGGMVIDSSGTVANFTANGSATWNVFDAVDSVGQTLTITGTLGVSGGRLSFFSGTNTSGDGLSLVINEINKSAGGANLEFGFAGSTFRGLKSLTVTGQTTMNAAMSNIIIAADTASFGNVSQTAGGIFNSTNNATFGVFTQSGGSFAIYNVVGGTGQVSVAGLSGAAGFLQVANGAPASTTLGELTIDVAGNDSYSYGGILRDSVTAGQAHLSVVKSGSGTQILSGTNTYSGTTTVNAGTLQMAKEVSLYSGSTASWTAANITVKSGATLAFNVGGTGEFTSSDIDILKGLGTATTGFTAGSRLGFDTTNAGGNFSYGSSITDSNGGSNVLGIVKLGSGTLTLSGSNAYTGVTTISAGTLQLGNGGATGTLSTSSVIVNNGNFAINRSNAVAQGTDFTASAITGTGGFIQAGTGTTTLTAANTYTGATIVSAGKLELDAVNALAFTSSIMVASGGSLQINASNSVNDSAAITLSGGTILRDGGVSETMGALTLTANSTLDFGTGAIGSLAFGSYTSTPTFLITVANFAPGNSLVFGTNLTSVFSGDYSSYFDFGGHDITSAWNGSSFTITSVPEPSTIVAGALMLGVLLWPRKAQTT